MESLFSLIGGTEIELIFMNILIENFQNINLEIDFR